MKDLTILQELKKFIDSYLIPLIIGAVILLCCSYINSRYVHLSEYSYSFLVILPVIMLVSYLAEKRRNKI